MKIILAYADDVEVVQPRLLAPSIPGIGDRKEGGKGMDEWKG